MQYTIIILTYKYLEECFTCDTLVIPSLSQFLSFLAICKKISPTRFGFAHIRLNVTLIVLLEHAENRTHRKSALPWSKACVITSHTQHTFRTICVQPHTPFFLINKRLHTIGNVHDMHQVGIGTIYRTVSKFFTTFIRRYRFTQNDEYMPN